MTYQGPWWTRDLAPASPLPPKQLRECGVCGVFTSDLHKLSEGCCEKYCQRCGDEILAEFKAQQQPQKAMPAPSTPTPKRYPIYVRDWSDMSFVTIRPLFFITGLL